MIDSLPSEIDLKIFSALSQEDKVSLSYVSKRLYRRVVPLLYRNLYLNVRPYFPSDLDKSLGTNHWSVLYFLLSSKDEGVAKLAAKEKFSLLVRSLESNPDLCSLVKRVHCTWHLHRPTLVRLIHVLRAHGNTCLQYFDNFLDLNVMFLVSTGNFEMLSMDVVPPTVLPEGQASHAFYNKVESIIARYDWYRLKMLTLHVNACTFFPHLSETLKIKTLCLNLRSDTYEGTFIEQPHFKIFDTEFLEDLTIVSWYASQDDTTNLYDKWRLKDFWNFHNIRKLNLLSLFCDSSFLVECFENFPLLEKLKVDFMFDIPVSNFTVETLRQSQCSKTLRYIDLKFEEIDLPLLSIEQDETSFFVINLVCKCKQCFDTYNDIITSKYFPSAERLIIKDFHDVESRNFIMQMFKLYPIIPYTHFVDEYPSIAYNCKSLKDHVDKVNELLGYSDHSGDALTTTNDIIRLYHAYLHSMKKTLDYFLRGFPNLEYLTLNDLPTKVIHVDEQQSCNVPIFYSDGYKSNQVYELVNDESLFD